MSYHTARYTLFGRNADHGRRVVSVDMECHCKKCFDFVALALRIARDYPEAPAVTLRSDEKDSRMANLVQVDELLMTCQTFGSMTRWIAPPGEELYIPATPAKWRISPTDCKLVDILLARS